MDSAIKLVRLFFCFMLFLLGNHFIINLFDEASIYNLKDVIDKQINILCFTKSFSINNIIY